MTWTAAERRAKNAERIAARKCVTCVRALVPREGVRCEYCEEKKQRAARRWRRSRRGRQLMAEGRDRKHARRDAAGQCRLCQSPAVPGRRQCAPHLEADKVRTQRWLAARDEREARST